MKRISSISTTLLCGFLTALGCQSIAGIEERTFESEEDSLPPPTDQCIEYCDLVMTNCTDENEVYTTEQTCLDACGALPPGSDVEPFGNTVACRMEEAEKAAREPGDHCKLAGPGGGDTCGSDCEAWCTLMESGCADDFAKFDGRCLELCSGLQDNSDFDLDFYYSTDTLECRLIHVSAAQRDPAEHCAHAALIPGAPCLEPEDDTPQCEDFCRLVQVACEGDLAVYESTEQCMAACEVFDPGTPLDQNLNTVGCRKYHAYSAMADTKHCPHTSPSGDGHCAAPAESESGSGSCDSYCLLLEAACGTEFGTEFGDQATCQANCVEEFADKGALLDTGYTIETASSGDTLQCRILHAVRSLEDSILCDAAFGAPPCE